MAFRSVCNRLTRSKYLSILSATTGIGCLGLSFYMMKRDQERETQQLRFFKNFQNKSNFNMEDIQIKFNFNMENLQEIYSPKINDFSELRNQKSIMIDTIISPITNKSIISNNECTDEGIVSTIEVTDEGIVSTNENTNEDIVKKQTLRVPHLDNATQTGCDQELVTKEPDNELISSIIQNEEAELIGENDEKSDNNNNAREFSDKSTITDDHLTNYSNINKDLTEGRTLPARPPPRRIRKFILQHNDVKGFQEMADLFEPILAIKQVNFNLAFMHTTDLNAEKINYGAPFDTKYVISTRVRAGRSIKDHALPPQCTHAQRIDIEREISTALLRLKGDLRGKYISIPQLTDERTQELKNDQLLFKKPLLLKKAGMTRDWPHARGVFHNKDKNFAVWLNEKDHARVISIEKGGNMQSVFTRFCHGLTDFEKSLEWGEKSFLKDERLGYILACPSNFGTGLRASVYMKLPFLSQDKRFDEVLETYRLKRRDVKKLDHGERVYDISNADRLGLSEVQLVQNVVDGVKSLIMMERNLEDGHDINDMIDMKPMPVIGSELHQFERDLNYNNIQFSKKENTI